MRQHKVSLKRLVELLSYDPITGLFRWKVRMSDRVGPGDSAGTLYPDGSRYILVDRVNHPAHVLARSFHYGEWPEGELEHSNGRKDDNRIENLREVPNQISLQNKKRRHSKVAGVSWNPESAKWRAEFSVDGRTVFLGDFESQAEAIAARQAAVLAEATLRSSSTALASSQSEIK